MAASHRYLASLSVTLVRIVISAVTDLSVVLITELIFLSFLYQVSVARGLPPEDVQEIFCTVPAGMKDPSVYPCIKGGLGGSKGTNC